MIAGVERGLPRESVEAESAQLIEESRGFVVTPLIVAFPQKVLSFLAIS
jgi:hypothetical protein